MRWDVGAFVSAEGATQLSPVRRAGQGNLVN